MPKLKFKSSQFSLNQYETVLDCLLRNKQYIPYACRAGMCQACLVRAVDCDATGESKKWIKQSLQDKGYTLACQWVPDSDVEAALPTVEEFSVRTKIKSLDYLNPGVIRFILDVEDKDRMFHYYPGQYVTLINPHGIARSYSVANNYEKDQSLEFHISQTDQGAFSGWLFNEAACGDVLHMRGPAGDCYYRNASAEEFPVILAATGTGLAPLYAILNNALNNNHQGEISLYHGGRTTDQLYYVEELERLSQSHPNLHYYPCVKETVSKSSGKDPKNVNAGSIEEVINKKMDTGTLAATRVFLCGAPDFVYNMRKQFFLKGAKSGNIYCDPFLEHSVAATGGTT